MVNEFEFEKIFDAVEAVENASFIWETLFSHSKMLKCDGLFYYHLPPPGALDFDQRPRVSFGFDNHNSIDWCSVYSNFSSYFNGKIKRAGEGPVSWTSAKQSLSLPNASCKKILNFFSMHDREGLIIPVYGPNGRAGVVVHRFIHREDKMTLGEARKLQWLYQFTHQIYCNKRNDDSAKLTSLSGREKEILGWVARGKSNSVIADIVGISSHTVNSYLRRIYLKTRTRDRTTASIRGIGEVLIDY